MKSTRPSESSSTSPTLPGVVSEEKVSLEGQEESQDPQRTKSEEQRVALSLEVAKMDDAEHYQFLIRSLEEKGYEIHYKTSRQRRSRRFLGLVLFSCFVMAWIVSSLYPFIMAYALLSGCWTLGLIMAAEWFIIRVVLKDRIESEAFRHGTLAKFMQKHFDGGPYYRSCTMSSHSLEPSRSRPPTVFAFHPHGIFSLGWSLCQIEGHQVFEGTRFCFADILYNTPWFFVWVNMFNKHGGVNGEFMKACMKERESLGLIPGGFEEATIHSAHHDRVYLKKRTGFIALAMRYGYEVRPVYSFGERTSYYNIQWAQKFRLWLNSLPLQIPGVFPWGRNLLLPWLPRKNATIHVVIGKTYHVPHIPKPTRAEVKAIHSGYMSHLQEMYDDLAPVLDPREDGRVPVLEIY